MLHKLSKYFYHEYQQCPERFWLLMNEETPETEADSFQLYFKQQNEALQQYALQLLQQKQGRTFEQHKKIEIGDLSATADLYERHEGLDRTAIYEIHNSKIVKGHYIWDLAYLAYCFKAAGEPLTKHFIIHVNPDYRYKGGSIDPASLLCVVEVTRQVWARLSKIEKEIEAAITFAKGPQPPTDLALHTCRSKDCLFIRRFHPNLPAHSIYDLKGINRETLQLFLKSGILSMLDVPEKYIQSDLQRTQLGMIRNQEPIIKAAELHQWLTNLRYPLYFIDYEAITSSIPVYEETIPFQHLVFQYSLHIIESPGAALQHYEFLAEGHSLPTAALLAQLSTELKDDSGSVLVWHDSFEKARNREMAALCPQYSSWLSGINDRIVDMEKIFSIDGGLFLHPDFMGRSSVKKVLPVLLPDAAVHSDLDISDGMTAAILWFRYLTEPMEAEAFAILRQQLLAYCKLDTMAMVQIFEYLQARY